MNMDYVRDFVVLAEHLNYSKAAMVLHEAQPVLSKHIAALEQELGVKLVCRGTRPVSLTAIGYAFLEEARELLCHHDECLRRIKRLQSVEPLHLTLGGVMFYRPTADLVAVASIDLRKHCRLLDFNINDDPSLCLLESLRTGETDVVITIGALGTLNRGTQTELTAQYLFSDPLVAIVPIQHPLASRESINPSEIAGEKILASRNAIFYEFDTHVHELLEERGIEVATYERAFRDAQSFFAFDFEQGIVIITSRSIPNISPKVLERYSVVKFDDPYFKADVHVVHRSEDDNPALAIFVDSLVKAVRESVSLE